MLGLCTYLAPSTLPHDVRLHQAETPKVRSQIRYFSESLKHQPIGSMYGIYANIWGILMVNVTIYSIHGSYGQGPPWDRHLRGRTDEGEPRTTVCWLACHNCHVSWIILQVHAFLPTHSIARYLEWLKILNVPYWYWFVTFLYSFTGPWFWAITHLSCFVGGLTLALIWKQLYLIQLIKLVLYISHKFPPFLIIHDTIIYPIGTDGGRSQKNNMGTWLIETRSFRVILEIPMAGSKS